MVQNECQTLSLVVAGHVDHGKSTIIGRLLADTNSLAEGKLEAIRENCRRNAKPFEYAFLLDALKEEQSQGITIDVTRCFFKTDKRNYMIIDAPGHIEFLKNMITGAAWAEAAMLVIDAEEGVRENSRRHGFMLSMLGIRQIAVLVNKMDRVGYDQQVFKRIVSEYSAFLEQINIVPAVFIPVSGRDGDNITSLSSNMSWYQGLTVIQLIDEFHSEPPDEEKPFRMPVQDVYKFTRAGDSRRIIAGTIESGRIAHGDEIIFYPSGKKSRVQSIEAFNVPQQLSRQTAGWAAGFTLAEQIYVRRGEVAAIDGQEKPFTTDRMRVNLFWLGKNPLTAEKKYLLKINSIKVEMQLESIVRVMDASNLEQKKINWVERHDVAECVFKLDQSIAFDLHANIPATGRFVVVDDYEISGGGIIVEALESQQKHLQINVQRRNIHWENPAISELERSERYNQKSCLIVVTGKPTDTLRKQVAKALEKQLFSDGKFVYFIGMANLLYGIDADIQKDKLDPDEVEVEYFRRLAEVANLMLDAGLILVVSAQELRPSDLSILETVLDDRAARIFTIWAGDDISTDIQPSLHLRTEECEVGPIKVKEFLRNQGIIFKI